MSFETMPDAGVVLAPTGNAANTFYYIYAYMNSGVIALKMFDDGLCGGARHKRCR